MAKVTSDFDKISNISRRSVFGPTPQDMKKILEIYKSNPLEASAFEAQDLFTKEIIRLRPDITQDVLMAESISQAE